jgi:hypothetical protein
MSVLVVAISDLNIFVASLTAGGMLVLVYGGYFLVTYLNARKMIRPTLRNTVERMN